jgi:hypothetical protein
MAGAVEGLQSSSRCCGFSPSISYFRLFPVFNFPPLYFPLVDTARLALPLQGGSFSASNRPGLCLATGKLSCAIFDDRNKNYLLDSLDHGVYCVPTNCGLPEEFHDQGWFSADLKEPVRERMYRRKRVL